MSAARMHFDDESAFRARAAALFEREAARITAALPDARIEHVGATSITGAATKGDLDILVGVPPEAFAHAEQTLAAMYERNEGSDRTSVFAAFKDDRADPPLGVQLSATSLGAPYHDFLLFRFLLREHPALLAEYNALKRAHQGASEDAYRAAKSGWIEAVLARFGPPPGGGR